MLDNSCNPIVLNESILSILDWIPEFVSGHRCENREDMTSKGSFLKKWRAGGWLYVTIKVIRWLTTVRNT